MPTFFNMYTLAVILSVISLAPAALYVVGKIRDPFHPLILAGVLSYFIAAHRIFIERSDLLLMLDEELYQNYLLVAILSVLGIYAGWWYAGRRIRRNELVRPSIAPAPQYHVGQLMLFAAVCAVVGTGIHFVFYEQYDISGYILDLKMLWITAAILCVQGFILSPHVRASAILVFLIAIAPPIDRFLVYGQRGDTFRLAVIAESAYLMLRRRPTKLVFLSAAAILGLTLGTLQLTRGMVESGEAPSRLSALVHVIPHFFEPPAPKEINYAEEFVFGAASMETVRQTDRYGYGQGLTLGLVLRFLPRGLFPEKDEWGDFYSAYNVAAIKDATGVTIPPGSAPSGFAVGFYEFGWACSIPWIVLGYFSRRLWNLMNQSNDLLYQGLFAGFTMALLYAISQDLLTAEVNLVYVFVPLPLIYRIARQPNAALYPLPDAELQN